MSWKILVSAGLLCIVASPVLAAPTSTTKLLGLDTAGNWVWSVAVTPDQTLFANSGATGTPPNTVGGSVAIEVGATASNRNLVSIGANATNFPNINPGTAIAGFPAGPGTAMTGNNAVAFLGSDFFATPAVSKEAFRLHTQGPTSAALTTTVALTGAYASNGRIAQGGQNFDTVLTGTFNGSVVGGNANLSDHVDVGDLAILAAHYDTAHAHPGQHWQTADFTGDGFVDVGDLAVLAAHYNAADPNWVVAGSVNLGTSPGAGALSGGAVPEPTSIVLLSLGGLFAAIRGIRRSC